MTKLDVAYVAQLARLNLSAEEVASFEAQLTEVLKHTDRLRQVNVENDEPAAHSLPLCNVFREDEPGPSLPPEEALRNAPQSADSLFIVPKVLE